MNTGVGSILPTYIEFQKKKNVGPLSNLAKLARGLKVRLADRIQHIPESG
jgi:hypothetical protein